MTCDLSELTAQYIEITTRGNYRTARLAGTSIAVHYIMDLLSRGMSFEDIIAYYSNRQLTKEHIQACCSYAYYSCQAFYDLHLLEEK